MVTRTYAVGQANKVRRRDNHTGPWVDVSVPSGPVGAVDLYDVMTDPNNPDRVVVVGQILGQGSNTGILVSHDAGATWFEPGGNWRRNKFNYEVWWVDSNVIWVVGDTGTVSISLDGGLTFNVTAGSPGPGYGFTSCIHALDAQTAIVSGAIVQSLGANDVLVWKTTDGGATWNLLNGGLALVNGIPPGQNPTGYPEGIWMSPDQQRIIVGTVYCQFLSTNGGASFGDIASVPPEMTRSGRHLTWYPAYAALPTVFRHTGGPVFHVYESLDQGASWTNERDNEFFEMFGAHFYEQDTGYFTRGGETFHTTDGGVTGTVSDPFSATGVDLMHAVWTGPFPLEPEDPPCGGCPEGFTLNPETNVCERIDTVAPLCSPTTLTVGPGATNSNYSTYGARFYENATGRPLPLIHPVGTDINDNASNPLNLLSTVNAAPWNNRLNDVGVWNGSGNTPYNEWIGFTACVQIAEEKTYYIGLGGDNYVRCRIDGQLFFESTNGSFDGFRNWFMIPITLTAGTHIIELEGSNLGSVAAFGAEIYDADQATLSAMTTTGEIDAVTVFSTQDQIGGIFDLGEESGCECPDGYALSDCNGILECIRIETAPFEPCPCYLATNCDDPTDQIVITLEEGAQPLDTSLTYIFDLDPDKCWTIENTDACDGEVININTGTIDAAGTVGIEDSPDFLWQVTGEPPAGTPPATPYAASVSDQLWFPGYGSLPGAAWITQTPTPHATTTGETRYTATFNIPAGFTPSLDINILTDNTGQVYLNGNLIADTTGAPTPWATPLNVIETTAAYFNVGGVNTLEVRVQNVGQGSNGFNMTSVLRSTELVGTIVTVVETFQDCEECGGTCYELTNCETGATIVVDDPTLAEYVGSVIEVIVDPNTTLCLQVEEIPCVGNTVVPLPGTIVECHTTCERCLPEPPPPPPPLNIRNRTVNPGYDTPGCPPEYVDKVNCKFAEAMYQEMASVRFGIEFCCENEINRNKWMIKKEALDLKMLIDPDACRETPVDCCPPCNVESGPIEVIQTLQCPAPTNVDSEGILLGDPPMNCQQIEFIAGPQPDVQTLRYTSCAGILVSTTLHPGAPAIVDCVDMAQPIVADPAITQVSLGSCG